MKKEKNREKDGEREDERVMEGYRGRDGGGNRRGLVTKTDRERENKRD